MEALLMAVTGVVNILCFVIGAKVGQAVSKGEKVEMPIVNPLKAAQEHQAKKEAEHQLNKIETIMSNIECYNGTEYGQKDVPKG
jgi:hypothetical protein